MRPLCALAMIALLVGAASTSDRPARSQTAPQKPYAQRPPAGASGQISPSLLCSISPDAPARLVCTHRLTPPPPSLEERLKRTVSPSTAFVSTSSLWVANNLATPETATRFLQGVTGNPTLAQKIAPTALRISKSLPARAGLAVAILASGGIALYEGLFSDDANAASTPGAPAPSKPVEVRLLGVFDQNGTFRSGAPAQANVSKPSRSPLPKVIPDRSTTR
jgi:hypothetical protein